MKKKERKGKGGHALNDFTSVMWGLHLESPAYQEMEVEKGPATSHGDVGKG